MNQLNFVGRLAAAPTLTKHGETHVAKFTLLSNEYAGKDKGTGESLESTVSIQFTAFDKKAQVIAEHCLKGDQVILTNARIQNNDYEKSGEKVYGYNFIVEDFEFGAPGAEKREQLANRA